MFLRRCLEMHILPQGLRLHFNLALQARCKNLVDSLKRTLNIASSDILRKIHSEVRTNVDLLHSALQDCVKNLQEEIGFNQTNILLGKVRKDSQRELSRIRHSHWRKLYSLKQLKQEKHSTIVEPQTPDHSGSFRITANTILQQHSSKQHSLQEPGVNTKPHPKRTRDHRKISRKKKTVSTKRKQNHTKSFIPTDEDRQRFNPIVLAPNVTLTKEQIEICRMSDCFAPTPTHPLDVADQMLGTHAWAERLRWHRYHEKYKWNKTLTEKEDEDKTKEDGKDAIFVKRPWYKPTEKSAPRDDPALESFIEACTRDFLNVRNRKRIKDNLTTEQRKALQDLRNLPLTHRAACRFADKSSVTVITSLQEDDNIIRTTLDDKDQYSTLNEDPIKDTCKKVEQWANKWMEKGEISNEVCAYVTNTSNSRPAKCKPLVKTHKTFPYPYRLLLSGSGTPIQPLSKFVQLSISHLTDELEYQVMDTKEFLQKMEKVNRTVAPLPTTATLAVCDVIALYPSVDNTMGVPAVANMLKEYPSPIQTSTKCIVEGLQLALENNTCAYTDSEGDTVFATPNRGTAMGPCHACDYVDVFMNQIDKKLVEESPVPLVSSLNQNIDKHLDWSRFRDDGFAILPHGASTTAFEAHLQALHPPRHKMDCVHWTSGRIP